MMIQAHTMRRFAAVLATAALGAAPAAAQFVPSSNYQPVERTYAPSGYQQPATAPATQPHVMAPTRVYSQPGRAYRVPAYQAPAPVSAPATAYRPAAAPQAAPAYAAAPAPAAVTPTPVYRAAPAPSRVATIPPTQRYAAVTASPVPPIATMPPQRVASRVENALPAPQNAPAMQDAAAAVEPVDTPAMDYNAAQPVDQSHATGYSHYAGAWGGATGDGGCQSGGCQSGCDSAAGCNDCCDLGCEPCRPCRQWFVGVYGLYLDRANCDRTQVAYMTDTTGWTPGNDYYYQPSDPTIYTSDADTGDYAGAEIRFGTTIGCGDPCGCGPRYAWEVGYWAIDPDDESSTFGTQVGSTYPDRIYSTMPYEGLWLDIDGAGATWGSRPLEDYIEEGMPADGDITANDVRLVAVRVRRNFEAKNLELNLWKFGTPECCTTCSTCNDCGTDCCGVDSCDPCQPSRPPRRFFINGLCGLRYFRVDDDLGIDHQFTLVDGAGDPLPGWFGTQGGWNDSSNAFVFHDINTDNELVGFQLGCSMNWLIGCRWNVFADSNFGIYGNDIEVSQTVRGGGAATLTGPAVTNGSDEKVAYLGELRFGLGYQMTCNCRLTAAYRFLGAGGLALSDGQIPQAFDNEQSVSWVDADDSLLLHGGQLGIEWKL